MAWMVTGHATDCAPEAPHLDTLIKWCLSAQMAFYTLSGVVCRELFFLFLGGCLNPVPSLLKLAPPGLESRSDRVP